MRLANYKVIKLLKPEENATHQVFYESISKNKNSGGYGCGSVFRGSYEECLEIKKGIDYELSKSKKSSFMVSTKPQKNR